MPKTTDIGETSQCGIETPAQALVALGGNIPSRYGSPAETLLAAMRRMERPPLKVERASRIYTTPCFPKGAGPDYTNAAVVVSAPIGAHAVLKILNVIEIEFGRRRYTRWGRRTLDLDLIAFGDMVLPDAETHGSWRDLSPELQRLRAPDELILPHPRLQDRAFVLVPLFEVAPEWRHPITGRTVAQMHNSLPMEEKAVIKSLPTSETAPISLAKRNSTA